MRLLFISLAIVITCAIELAFAAPAASKHPIRVLGRNSAIVTTADVTLGDIADVSARLVEHDEAVIALQKIKITTSPKPGEVSSLSAADILSRMKSAGAKLEDIGYLFPRVIKIQRASRVISKEEVLSAIESANVASGREILLKELKYKENFHVLPGIAEITAQHISSNSGKADYKISVKVEEHPARSFMVKAKVDEWKEVPVASRPIPRGTVLGPDDVMMARMNLGTTPKDMSFNLQSIVGLEASKNIAYGEVFRRAKLEIPPTIEAGSKVTISVKSGLLEATATGMALDSGATGQKIRVRNERSRKIVVGTIIEPGLVGVQP